MLYLRLFNGDVIPAQWVRLEGSDFVYCDELSKTNRIAAVAVLVIDSN